MTRREFIVASLGTIAGLMLEPIEKVLSKAPKYTEPSLEELIKGLDITTVQWEETGGMCLNFKLIDFALEGYGIPIYGGE